MKTYTTAQVVALLTRHPDWEFKAPDRYDRFPCVADSDGIHIEFKNMLPEGPASGDAPIRSDWVRTKPKVTRRRIELGTIMFGVLKSAGSRVDSNARKIAEALEENLGPGKWRIVAVEVKR